MDPSTGTANNAKSMSIIVTKGSLDRAYPPFILATTAAAMDVRVTMIACSMTIDLSEFKREDMIDAIAPGGTPPGMTTTTNRVAKR